MNYRYRKALTPLAEALTEALKKIPLPPGELRVQLTIDKDWNGFREVGVIFQDRPRTFCEVRSCAPDRFDGHPLPKLPFARIRRALWFSRKSK